MDRTMHALSAAKSITVAREHDRLSPLRRRSPVHTDTASAYIAKGIHSTTYLPSRKSFVSSPVRETAYYGTPEKVVVADILPMPDYRAAAAAFPHQHTDLLAKIDTL